jgi:hypothetical protein
VEMGCGDNQRTTRYRKRGGWCAPAAVGPSTLRRVAAVVGVLLLPVAAIVLAIAALLRPGGWAGAALVLAGALLLAIGIGMVSAPAHAEHLAAHRGRTDHREPFTWFPPRRRSRGR